MQAITYARQYRGSTNSLNYVSLMFNMDYTYYTDEFLNACLSNYTDLKLTARSFVALKDEDLEEAPVPVKKESNFLIDFGLNLPQESHTDNL